MNGAVTLQALAAAAALRRIPAVLMSSLPEQSLARQAAAYAAFLRKPFKVEQMVELAQRLTRNTGDVADPVD